MPRRDDPEPELVGARRDHDGLHGAGAGAKLSVLTCAAARPMVALVVTSSTTRPPVMTCRRGRRAGVSSAARCVAVRRGNRDAVTGRVFGERCDAGQAGSSGSDRLAAGRAAGGRRSRAGMKAVRTAGGCPPFRPVAGDLSRAAKALCRAVVTLAPVELVAPSSEVCESCMPVGGLGVGDVEVPSLTRWYRGARSR